MSERPMPEEIIKGEKEKMALFLVRKFGPQFAEKHPEIVQDVRDGMAITEIAKKYKVEEIYGVTSEIARGIVGHAIRSLMSPEERDFIYAPKRSETGRYVGLKTMREKKGLFGMTPEQMVAAGKAGGAKCRALGKGVFAMTSEELSAASRKGNEKPKSDSWFAGEKINGMTEGDFANYLASLPEYQLDSGYFKGSPDYTKIADAVNVVYGRNRTRSATKGFFENEKVRARRKAHHKDGVVRATKEEATKDGSEFDGVTTE